MFVQFICVLRDRRAIVAFRPHFTDDCMDELDYPITSIFDSEHFQNIVDDWVKKRKHLPITIKRYHSAV